VPVVSFDLARGGIPEKQETSRAVAHLLKHQFLYRVERHMQIRAHLSSTTSSTLDKIQAISGDARENDEMPKLTPDNPVWSHFSNPVLREMLVELANDPDGFVHDSWVQKGVLRYCSDDMPSEEGRVHYYLRTRTVPLKVAEAEDSAFLRSHPVNMGFIMARKWSRGLAERSQKEMKEVLTTLGYKDAAFDIPTCAHSTRVGNVASHYCGMSTAQNPGERQKQDAKQNGSTSLHLNLVAQEDNKYAWKTWKILPLTQEVEGPLAVRQDPTLGDIESILISLLPMSSNSQPGGHNFNVSFDRHIAEPMQSLVQRLPPPAQAVSNPGLQQVVHGMMVTMKELFAAMREAKLNVGKAVSNRSFNNALRELCDKIRVVNGLVTMLTVMKDTPAEVQRGSVDGALFSLLSEVGPGMTLHRNIIEFLFQEPSQFERLGPHINFWEIIIIHRWWGCLVLLVGRFIRVLNPLVLHTHSMVVNGVMTSPELVRLAREFPDETEVTVNTIHNSRLMEMQAPVEVRDFVDRVGVLKVIKTGPGEDHKSILVSNYDPGATSYSMLRKFETRLMALVTCKEMALDRVAEKFARDGVPDGFPEDRDGLLAAIIAEVERLSEASGVNTQIEACRSELKLMKRGMYAFSSKKIEDGKVIRTGQGGSRVMTSISFGLRANGDPYSVERQRQLDEVAEDYGAAVSGGLTWTLKGPNKSTPGSTDFDLWFLSRAANVSFRQSSNHYAQPSQNTSTQITSLVEKTHQLAVDRREQRIAIYGSWRVAEFIEKAKEVLKLALVFRGKVRPFTESLRIATCLACGALAAGYDRNASHLCTHDLVASESRKVVLGTGQSTEPQFSNYLVVLYVHDVIQYRGISSYLNHSILGEWGIFSSPTSAFLFDEQDRLLDHLPRCLGQPGVRGMDKYIYHTDGTHINVCVAAAVDAVLKENTRAPPCWAFDGPDQSSHWNSTTLTNASKILADTPADLEVRICMHPGCGHTRLEHREKRKSNKHRHGEKVAVYRTYIPRDLFEIPYFFSRVLVYRALVENDSTSARAMMFRNP
jgi:hypothetical protein